MASFCGVSLWHQRSWLGDFHYLEGIAMTKNEIQEAILQVCKVSGNDSDFSVVRFYTLCDRLVELGAAAEREECAKVLDEMAAADRLSNYYQVAALRIRERGAP
jgi:hypothetical protein